MKREVSFHVRSPKITKKKGFAPKMIRKDRLLSVFSTHSIMRRSVASWFFMAFIILLINPIDYAALDFLAGKDWSLPLLLFFVFFLVFSVVSYFASHAKADSFAMLAGLVFCTCLWLAGRKATVENWLFCLILVGLFAFVLWDFVRETEMLFANFRVSPKTALAFAIACGILCAAVIAVTTCCKYLSFSSATFDFGIFVQMYHNMAESFSPITTCERDQVLSHFAVHLSPIYYVLLPFYLLFPSPLTLQIGQAVVVASGIVPLLLLMRKWKLSPKAQIAFAALYFLNPAVTKGCFFDLHENAFIFPLLLWLFWAYETEKLPLLAAFAALCCLVKEDSAVYVTLFGLYAIFAGKGAKRKLMGLGMAVYAVLYFLFAVWYINSFGTGIMIDRFDNISSEGTLLGVVFTAFANPGFFFKEVLCMEWASVQYIINLLLPLAFLPLATGKPSRWLLLVPMLLNLMTDYPYQLELRFQYHFGISAFLIYAALQNWKDLSGKARRYLLPLALAAAFILYSYLVIPDTVTRIKEYQAGKETFSVMEDTLAAIPVDASVIASTFLLPHVADRYYAYDADYHKKADTDLVILDVHSEHNRNKEKGWMKLCEQAGYICLVETKELMIYVSPDWQGDESALKEAIREVATIVSESKPKEDRLMKIKKIISVLPTDASVNVSETLLPYFSSSELYCINEHTKADTDFIVVDVRGEETDALEEVLSECLMYGYAPLLEIEGIAVYISPLWWGDEAALRQSLREMGYLPLI